MVNFDDILFEVNDFGKYQKIRYLLICLAALLPPIVTYLHSFTAARPEYRCQNPYDVDDVFTNNKTFENMTLGKCDYMEGNTTKSCNKWVFDKTYYETTLTEQVNFLIFELNKKNIYQLFYFKWSLICDKKKLWGGHLQTVYFAGYLVGSLILGVLADMYV